MTKIVAIACAATLAAATFASANELTAPVAVAQADAAYGAGLNTAATWTAAAIVVGGALIVDNASSSSSSD